MSAHILLYLLSKIKCEAYLEFYLKFNKFNNTEARMLQTSFT